MSNLISQKKFADICDVSPPAISKAIRQQRLKKVGTKIDLDCPMSKSYLKLQQESEPTPQKKTSKKKTEKKKPPVDAEDRPIQLSLDLTDQQLLAFDKPEIDKLDKIESARTKKFNRHVARGKYIKREMVATVFAEMHTVDSNELKAMEDRLTPEICGIFKKGENSDEAIAVRELLKNEISSSLEHIQRIIDTFLKKHESKK